MVKAKQCAQLALYLPNLDGGGAERMMVNLASGFARRGLQVDLVLADARGPYLADVGPGVNVVDLRSAGVMASLPKLVSYLRSRRPEAVLATLNHASVAALLARKLSAVPVRAVVRESNMMFPSPTRSSKSRALKAATRFFYPWADAYIAVSQGVADDLQRFARLEHHKVHTIYNPVISKSLFEKLEVTPEHPWFGADAAAKLPVVLGVGRLTGQKDFATLLRAFAAAQKVRPARLVILGEGERREELERLAHTLGISERVSLPGFVDNPFALMARADTFVLSSRHEGLPGALIQAMACGCKVVSTDCPSGPSEILKGGKLAPLVAVGDDTKLAQAIAESLALPAANPELRTRALDFSEEKIIPQYLEVLLPGYRNAGYGNAGYGDATRA